jgi:hypothetical protein
MKRTRWRFTAEFKQKAVRLVRVRGVSIAQVARELELLLGRDGPRRLGKCLLSRIVVMPAAWCEFADPPD